MALSFEAAAKVALLADTLVFPGVGPTAAGGPQVTAVALFFLTQPRTPGTTLDHIAPGLQIWIGRPNFILDG